MSEAALAQPNPARRLRVALVRQRYNPYGGAERFVERALAALVAEGADVTLIAREWVGVEPAPDSGFTLQRCNPRRSLFSRLLGGRTGRDKAFAACATDALARGGFDITQSHERLPGCMIFRAGDGVHAAWLDHRSRLLSPLGRLGQRLSPYHRYVVAQEAAMFAHPRLRAVICNSALVKDEIARYYGVSADKLVVIENGVDLEAFHPNLATTHRAAVRQALGVAETTPLFLYVGGGFERKGVPRLLDALARVPTGALVVVGGDRRLAALQRRAAALGLAGRVHFVGPQKDVKPYYGAADAFVLPTLYDPFPNAALEALASGLPVVTSTTCGAAARIVPGQNGFVCDALDVAALAGHLATLAEPGVAARMREAARASVADLSLAAMASQLLALYRRLAPTPSLSA